MIHIFKTEIHCDFIDEDRDDVKFMADLAYRLLRQIPFDELKKLVKITKADPRSPEIKNKMNHLTTPNQAERNWLLQLERDGVVSYEASVNIPDDENTNLLLTGFAEYCEKEHGLFIPSWMIDGYNKAVDANTGLTPCIHPDVYKESTFGGDVVCMKCKQLV